MQQVFTYNVDSNNNWAPLADTMEKDDEETDLPHTQTTQETIMPSRWTLLRALFGGQTIKSMVLDSGATLHFVQQEDNLPIIGPSHKQVQMPNGHIETVSHKAQLRYATLSDKA